MSSKDRKQEESHRINLENIFCSSC